MQLDPSTLNFLAKKYFLLYGSYLSRDPTNAVVSVMLDPDLVPHLTKMLLLINNFF